MCVENVLLSARKSNPPARGTCKSCDFIRRSNVIRLTSEPPGLAGPQAPQRSRLAHAPAHHDRCTLKSTRQERDYVESHELGVKSSITKPVDVVHFTGDVWQVAFRWLLLNPLAREPIAGLEEKAPWSHRCTF
jgi:hypothetical protein